VLVYFTGQGLVQLLNLSIGLLLLRWLNTDNYAQYSVAFGFQTTLTLLTDLGFAGTIVALVGPRGNDPAVIGSYIRSGRHLRIVMLSWLTPVAAVVYIAIARRHGWGIITSTLLFASIISSSYFSGMAYYYSSPLTIRGRLHHLFRHQLAAAIFRVAAGFVFHLTGGLLAWTMSWINALSFLLIGLLNRRESRSFVALPAEPLPAVTRQMIQYVLPNLPGLIFYAFQGQIGVFLISFFGQSHSIAEVGALGRLAQLFVFFTGFNTMVIEPFMARAPRESVLRIFLSVLSVASCICVVVCLLGFSHSSLFLLLIGARYKSLAREAGWTVLVSCLGYLGTVVWTMNLARRWIFWITSWLSIVTILATQIVFLHLVKVDSTLHTIYFGVATSIAALTANLSNSVYGYICGPKIVIPDTSVTHQMEEVISQTSEV
jgi:hypothetical protein